MKRNKNKNQKKIQKKMSDDHDEGDEEGGPTAAFSLVRYENPQIVQLEVENTFLTIINTISIIFII